MTASVSLSATNVKDNKQKILRVREREKTNGSCGGLPEVISGSPIPETVERNEKRKENVNLWLAIYSHNDQLKGIVFPVIWFEFFVGGVLPGAKERRANQQKNAYLFRHDYLQRPSGRREKPKTVQNIACVSVCRSCFFFLFLPRKYNKIKTTPNSFSNRGEQRTDSPLPTPFYLVICVIA